MSLVWSSASEFWAMGGAGLYVWGSFGVTAVALVAEVWGLRRRRRAALAQIRAHAASEPG
jgi:heme exporter protein D